MGLFDRFRKKDDSVLPSEVDEYYNSELKTRRGSSLLMALLALAVTLIVAAGLFFGVRAIYRAVNDDGPATVDTVNPENEEQKPEPIIDENNFGSGEAPGNSGLGSDNPDNTPNNATPNAEDQEQSGPPANDTPPTGDNIPSTGDSPRGLPSTGDEGL